ncbi:MAG TPA: lycopene cyclase family protein [Kineosporiaceae bacterium]
MRVHDVAIVGAGVSGLVLARLLLQRDPGLSLLLVDGARNEGELRTLSFWAAGTTPLDDLVRHRWDTLRVAVEHGVHDVRLAEHTYRTLFLADLRADVTGRLAVDPGHRVLAGRVHRLAEDADGVTLTVGAAELRARWVLDSRFHLPDLQVDRHRYHLLRQHFRGWRVRTRRDVFAPHVATLLDFRVDVRPGTGFCYLLPFSRRDALVELVTFEPVDHRPLLSAYLLRSAGLAEDDVELLDQEAGITPLTEQPFRWRRGQRVRALGVAAGRLKPSTGYALTRIVEDAVAIVASLEREGHPFAVPQRSAVHQFLDGVLLELWTTRPEQIPAAFSAMFRRAPADRVLRFLDERARPADLFSVIVALPKTPFTLAALRWSTRSLLARRRSGGGGTPHGLGAVSRRRLSGTPHQADPPAEGRTDDQLSS